MVGRYCEHHQITGFNIYINLLAYILGGETFCHLEYIMLFLKWENGTVLSNTYCFSTMHTN